MRRLTFLIVLAAFISSCGGQWVVLQGVAWANMIREFSQEVPFTQAVQMTLSGQYPCELCQAIAEKRQQQNDKISSPEKQEKKVCSSSVAITPSALSIAPQDYPAWHRSLCFRSEAPPVPPPRSPKPVFA